MAINDKIRNEKLQYDINKESAKIFEISSGKTHKQESLTAEETLPLDQSWIIDRAKWFLLLIC